MGLDDALTGPPAVTPHFWNSQVPLGSLDLSTLLEIQFQGPSFLANEFGGWFSNEDQMAREDAFWAGEEPALAREPNPAYTEGMIRVTGTITIDEEEIHQQFIRASGPGGQNVNKVATAVQLRFDVAHSPSLPEDVRERLTRLAGKRLTKEGYLIIDARRFRTQEQNRQDSVARLVALIRQAAQRGKGGRWCKDNLLHV
jgi:ribosome-associated protein